MTLPPVLFVIQWWMRPRKPPRLLAVAPFSRSRSAGSDYDVDGDLPSGPLMAKTGRLPRWSDCCLPGEPCGSTPASSRGPGRWRFSIRDSRSNQHQWWQYLFPIAAIALPAALWFARHRIGRGPLAAVLIYCGVLFPMLGFFNIYYALTRKCRTIFSTTPASRSSPWPRPESPARSNIFRRAAGAAYAAVAAWLVLLAAISFRQTFIYHDLETLYRDTIAKNPRGTIAYSNLGVLLNDRGDNRRGHRSGTRAIAAGSG